MRREDIHSGIDYAVSNGTYGGTGPYGTRSRSEQVWAFSWPWESSGVCPDSTLAALNAFVYIEFAKEYYSG